MGADGPFGVCFVRPMHPSLPTQRAGNRGSISSFFIHPCRFPTPAPPSLHRSSPLSSSFWGQSPTGRRRPGWKKASKSAGTAGNPWKPMSSNSKRVSSTGRPSRGRPSAIGSSSRTGFSRDRTDASTWRGRKAGPRGRDMRHGNGPDFCSRPGGSPVPIAGVRIFMARFLRPSPRATRR